MNIAELNHVALLTRDLEASVRFYRDVIGLAPIPRPAFSFSGAWLRIGAGQELHLIAGERSADPDARARGNHFAVRVGDVDGAAAHLRAKEIPFRGPVRRPDGARQIFLSDPDGHVIELCGELP